MSQPRWGRTRCRRLLTSLSVLENKRIGTFTERQRAELVARLSAKENGGGAASRRDLVTAA